MKKGKQNCKMETPMTDKQTISTSPMKQSVSLTSLPPSTSTGQHDVSDSSIAAKLIIERPYNSLKKKRNSEREFWRNSWGSNQSYSSCSLQSNATNTFTGKDDFWLALQPNYNYIMDTNLLDSCREARGELERSYSTETSHIDQKKMNGGKQNDDFIIDLKRLRRWLREMENQLLQFPSISDAIKLKDFELEKLQKKNMELYQIIVSHAKLVGACTRSLSRQEVTTGTAETLAQEKSNETKFQLQQQQQEQEQLQQQNDDENCYSSLETQTTCRSHGSGTSNSEWNLKGLERRYHSLYLKAFETTLLLENLLARKNDDLRNSNSHSSSSDVDEGPAAKLARFTSNLIAESNQRKSNSTQAKKKQHEQSNGIRSDDDDDCRFPNYFNNTTLIDKQANGFDADSEGSDCEIVPNVNSSIEEKIMNNEASNCNGNPIKDTLKPGQMVSNPTSSENSTSKSSSLPSTPTKQHIKRPRKVNSAKFNHTNRESKNCGTFYFKHSDTEPETGNGSNSNANDWSSQDATSEVYSEDDNWFYSNGQDKNENVSMLLDANSSMENFQNLTHTSMQASCNESISIDAVDSPASDKQILKTMGTETPACQATKSTLNVSVNCEASQKKPYKEVTKQYSKECIQQLVHDAETLVRDEILMKTPLRNRRQTADQSSSSSSRKMDNSLNIPKIKRVEQWLKNQTQSARVPSPIPTLTTDGEASCEYTESDSAARDSDGSEGFADSVATCLPCAGSNSQCTSTEIIGGSTDHLKESSDNNCPSAKIVSRSKRRNSERPLSVSCISQLTQQKQTNCSSDDANNQGLANHSISESALDTLNTNGSQQHFRMKASDSKGSLKRRRMRTKKKQRSESGSGSGASDESGCNRRGSFNSLIKSESFSGHIIIHEKKLTIVGNAPVEAEHEENFTLPKPNFQLGAYTSNVFGSAHLGTLAPLAFYNCDQNAGAREPSYTGTEDNSNLSEQQAWDDYQEKYMSEAYSEGRDSDAARKLLEFGDDYRNFLDSQSDCCSSLSAANNLDSMSPPRGRKPMSAPLMGNKSLSKSPSDDDNAMRRRRALELETERRRRNQTEAEDRRKVSAETILSRSSYKSLKTPKASINRKLEMEFNKSLLSSERRRIKSNEHKGISSSSSVASSDAENDSQIDVVLNQSRKHLENTQALKIRRHLLRPEDYDEIINTCSENKRCLETVLHMPGGSVLSIRRHEDIRELLSSWESLLHWSENESVAKQYQEEMAVLVGKLNKIGTSNHSLDTESAIHFAIQETQNEKTQLNTHRSAMLRLNASVHSWLTRHEKRKQIEATKSLAAANKNNNNINTAAASTSADGVNPKSPVDNEVSTLELTAETIKEKSTQDIDTSTGSNEFSVDEEFHKQLKNEVGNMYKTWEEADRRVKSRLENLTTSLIAWKQFESSLNEFKEALGKDTGALKRLTGALEMGSDMVTNNLAHDVKEVAKRLSEKMDNNHSSATMGQQTLATHSNIKLNQVGALTFNLPSNGSLSDSGISDGGCSSDYGLSERERRLGALRRLAKQLEQALVPGSAALNSITQRMEMAESELRSLQETCRELIVRTAASQPPHLCPAQSSIAPIESNVTLSTTGSIGVINPQAKAKTTKRSTQNKRKSRRRTNSNGAMNSTPSPSQPKRSETQFVTSNVMAATPQPDPDDPKDDTVVDIPTDKRSWAWRVAKYAIPVQLALVALFCAACLMEPHCCDGLNNFSWSLSPQLRYVRGPPPI